MVLASHIIFTAYGFWLPNDPRGSWSDFVGAWELLRFGNATKANERGSLARRPHDRFLRLEAKQALKYPAVLFDGLQARAIARGFASFTNASALTVWASAIMPDHVHMVVARHGYIVEQIVNLLKGAATRELAAEQLHPLAAYPTKTGRLPKAFARGQWKVFLDSVADIQRAIRYVEANPIKEGYRRQRWHFVQPFDAAAMPALPSLRSGRG